MTYNVIFDAPAPVEVYDAMHTAVLEVAGSNVDGLLVHIGHATSTGFRVIEVWESKEEFDRFNAEVLGPIVAQSSDGGPPPPPPAEFDLRGLVLPKTGVLI